MTPPSGAFDFDRQAKSAIDQWVAGGRVVVTASPGTGKTTRLPSLLLRALDRAGDPRAIWVLEPRRVAATLAARYVAERHGEPVGKLVGYHVRHDKRCTEQSRIVFMTYGMFLQRLTHKAALDGVAAVLLDEFHERTWQQDASLALAVFHQSGRFGLGILSATLQAERIAQLLAPATICPLDGPTYPVEVQYLPMARQQTLVAHTVASVRQVLSQHQHGHVLVFLSGPKEIGAVTRALSATSPTDVAVLPLYASLDGKQQRRALAPAPGSSRKIIVATNIAESSVTLDGVRIVIDAGHSLQAHSDVASGIGSLRLGPISQASAIQRAGRAGRQGPGLCLRLYSAASFQRRDPFDAPEVQRLDLTEMVLRLAALGLSMTDCTFVDEPPPASVKAAQETLRHIGALGAEGEVTPLGRQLAGVALHPRLARVALAALVAGLPSATTAMLLAILEAPHAFDALRPIPAVSTASDVEEALALGHRIPAWTQATREHERMLSAVAKRHRGLPDDDALTTALLAGFGDRVARRLGDKSTKSQAHRTLALAGARTALLDDKSGVDEATFVLCVGGRHEPRLGAHSLCVTLAHAIDASRLLEADPLWLGESEETSLTASGRIVRTSKLTYAGIPIHTQQSEETDPARIAKVLRGAALPRLRARPEFLARYESLEARLAYLGAHVPLVQEALVGFALDEAIDTAVAQMAVTARRLDEIKDESIWSLVEQALPPGVLRALEAQAPTHLTLAGGKRLPVRWRHHAPPYVESYLQDFFGHKEAVWLGNKTTRLIVHLWAPNRRPLQVTDDLASFWKVHYPSLRKQLSRRYPRHRWPE